MHPPGKQPWKHRTTDKLRFCPWFWGQSMRKSGPGVFRTNPARRILFLREKMTDLAPRLREKSIEGSSSRCYPLNIVVIISSHAAPRPRSGSSNSKERERRRRRENWKGKTWWQNWEKVSLGSWLMNDFSIHAPVRSGRNETLFRDLPVFLNSELWENIAVPLPRLIAVKDSHTFQFIHDFSEWNKWPN